MKVKLKLNKDNVDDISLERVHRVGKTNVSVAKPSPSIAKFTFHKGKEFVLSIKPKVFKVRTLQLPETFLRKLSTKESFSFRF